MTLVQTEPKKIYIGQNVADMQGPCPTGFHVPSKDERQKVIDSGISIGAWSSNGYVNFISYLKVPLAGGLVNGNKDFMDSYGYYWTSNQYNGSYSYRLDVDINPKIDVQTYAAKTLGASIRAFKNTPVIPDNGWTTLYAGTGDAGIFWDSTNGYISISSDGINRITIADKNLGATVVWNYGDTLSQANCGNYYQRGNNYGFPFTGTVTTSSTAVDASAYGPGNYYNSSTFITTNPRDSSNNANLRGGVSGATKEIKKVTIRPNGTEKQIRPAGWVPGANTVAYYPLNGDANDYAGNYNGTVSQQSWYTENNRQYFYGKADTSEGANDGASITLPIIPFTEVTLSIWCKKISGTPQGVVLGCYTDSNNSTTLGSMSCNSNYFWGNYIYGSNNTFENIGYPTAYSNGQWHMLTLSLKDGSQQAFFDKTMVGTSSRSSLKFGVTNSVHWTINRSANRTRGGSSLNGYFGEAILEKVAWDITKVQEVYDLQKAKFGL